MRAAGFGTDMLGDWSSLLGAHRLLAAGLCGAGVLLVLGLRAALHRSRIGRRLDSALTLLAVGLVFGAVAALGRDAHATLYQYAHAISVAVVVIGVVRLALILFVDFHLRERRGAAVSSIFRDVASAVTYFLIILLVLRLMLDINLASLIATSAVLTAIIGLALQDVLSSVISGLAIELEDPFAPGDWIRVGGYEGQVVETGWRTTRIRTRTNELVTLPNTHLAREPVVNYSRPDVRAGDTLTFEAAYEAPPHAVKEAVLAVLGAEPAVLRDPPPEIRTLNYRESGIEYAVRYFLMEFGELERIRDRLMTNLWYSLRRAGVRIPFPARDLFLHEQAPVSALERGDVATTLARVEWFAPLGEEGIRALAAHARRLVFGRGEAIVREGEPGDSFYVIEQGAVAVIIGRGDGGEVRAIAHLKAGDYFGEMSLLAGEPRSATVVAQEDVAVLEVGRNAFQRIVAADPAVLEPISQLAARRLDAQREQRRAEAAIPPFEHDPAAQRLLQRIKAFFHL